MTYAAVPWGLHFLQALDTCGYSDELASGLLVGSVGETSLRGDAPDAVVLATARRYASRVTVLGIRRYLLDIVVGSAEGRDWPRGVVGPMIVYGHALHNGGKFGPAIDIFSAVADSAFVQPERRLHAMYRRAFAARSMTRFDYAEQAYTQLESCALEWGSTHYALQAQLGLGKLEIERGHLTVAKEKILQVQLVAERCHDRDVVGKAHIDLAYIAGVMGDPLAVIEHAIAGHDGLTTRESRDRLLQNVAEALYRLGRPTKARELADWLASHASELHERQDAYSLRCQIDRETSLAPVTPADVERLIPLERALAELMTAS